MCFSCNGAFDIFLLGDKSLQESNNPLDPDVLTQENCRHGNRSGTISRLGLIVTRKRTKSRALNSHD